MSLVSQFRLSSGSGGMGAGSTTMPLSFEGRMALRFQAHGIP